MSSYAAPADSLKSGKIAPRSCSSQALLYGSYAPEPVLALTRGFHKQFLVELVKIFQLKFKNFKTKTGKSLMTFSQFFHPSRADENSKYKTKPGESRFPFLFLIPALILWMLWLSLLMQCDRGPLPSQGWLHWSRTFRLCQLQQG